MGQVANDMVNGFVCQFCGEFLDGDEPGYPRSCEDCKKPGDNDMIDSDNKSIKISKQDKE